jgi:hypothetical protein
MTDRFPFSLKISDYKNEKKNENKTNYQLREAIT